MLPNESIPLESITNTEKEWRDEISPEIEVYLDTKPTYGLTEQQVAERLTKFGKNELQDKKKSKIKHFLSFCKFLFYCFYYNLIYSFKKLLALLLISWKYRLF